MQARGLSHRKVWLPDIDRERPQTAHLKRIVGARCIAPANPDRICGRDPSHPFKLGLFVAQALGQRRASARRWVLQEWLSKSTLGLWCFQ